MGVQERYTRIGWPVPCEQLSLVATADTVALVGRVKLGQDEAGYIRLHFGEHLREPDST